MKKRVNEESLKWKKNSKRRRMEKKGKIEIRKKRKEKK